MNRQEDGSMEEMCGKITLNNRHCEYETRLDGEKSGKRGKSRN